MAAVIYILSLLLFVKGLVPVGSVQLDGNEAFGCQIQFFDASNGWLACEFPANVKVTLDGARTWRTITLPASPTPDPATGRSASLIRVEAQSATNAWILISDQVFVTNNRGEKWTKLFRLPLSSPDSQVGAISIARDLRTAVAITTSSTGQDVLLITHDAGMSWKKTPIEREQYRKIAFGSSAFIYLIGGNNVRYSTDGGNTWDLAAFTFAGGKSRPFVSGLDRPMSSFFMQNLGWLVYESGYVFRSENNGRSWYEIARPTQLWIEATSPGSFTIRFLTTDHGYQVGGDGILRESFDGGFTWRPISIEGNKIADITCFNLNSCYMLDNRGSLFRVDSVGPGGR